MTRKFFTQVSVLTLFLLALLAVPLGVSAGGVCGGAYIVEKGETLESIAATCGTTVSAITAANPGIANPLKVGQTIVVPGVSVTPSTPVATVNTAVPNSSTTTTTTVNNYYNTYNNYYDNTAPSTTTHVQPSYNPGRYTVQYGDTFSTIANRFGVSIYALWAANPHIWDINLIYVGQVLYIPGSSGGYYPAPVATPTEDPLPLTYTGSLSPRAPTGEVTLSNKANTDVYVSLQVATGDGSNTINEYPVNGTFTARIPAGWCVYVAWIGGEKFVGEFKLGGNTSRTITFYKNKVVVE